MPLRLHNTLTKRLEDFTPADPARVTFYSCGPTVYDDAHIGNFRSFLAADLLRRWLESPLCELADGRGGVHQGPRQVVHVMNITDVGHMTDDAEGGEAGEDRMAVAGRRLAEAKKSGKLPPGVEVNPNDPYQIARFYEARFKEDARRLGLKVVLDADADPTLAPRATENVGGMIAVIARLIDRGCAYVTGEPGGRVVYFDVQKFPPYGRLSGNTLDKIRTGAGGRISGANQARKRHPADFLLWKEDPRHIMKWPSPWGEGYPGWHIECTVMSLRARSASEGQSPGPLTPERLASMTLPDGHPLIDLHSGGEDNIFPHHECEIAQSCCAFNEAPADGTFAGLWFHPRFLLVEGDKMSKSKGNFYTPRDLFDRGIEPAAIRLELIRTHYRSNANFTMQGLTDSQRRIKRWQKYARWLQRTQKQSYDPPRDTADQLDSAVDAMNADLNIAAVIAAIDRECAAYEAPAPIVRRAMESAGIALSDEEEGELPAAPLAAEEAMALYQRGRDAGTQEQVYGLLHLLDAVLGVVFAPLVKATETAIGVFAPGVEPNGDIESRLRERRDARAKKDFKRSDAIRDELAKMGYAIKDLPGGKVEVRRA